MKPRKRLNLTLTDGRLAQLRRLQKRYKAKSMTRVVYDILSAIDAVNTSKADAGAGSDARQDINEMFNQFSEAERGARPTV